MEKETIVLVMRYFNLLSVQEYVSINNNVYVIYRYKTLYSQSRESNFYQVLLKYSQGGLCARPLKSWWRQFSSVYQSCKCICLLIQKFHFQILVVYTQMYSHKYEITYLQNYLFYKSLQYIVYSKILRKPKCLSTGLVKQYFRIQCS